MKTQEKNQLSFEIYKELHSKICDLEVSIAALTERIEILSRELAKSEQRFDQQIQTLSTRTNSVEIKYNSYIYNMIVATVIITSIYMTIISVFFKPFSQ